MQVVGMVLSLSMTSCENMLRVDPTTGLNAADHYSSTGEIYAAYLGLTASFNKVAEQTLVLAGLKGDLMRPTSNAPQEFFDIFYYRADNNTPYTSSKNYYDIVINCNDFLRRVIKFNRDVQGGIPSAVYKGMVSSAINYKVWSLLTIGKFWGEASVYELNMVDDNEAGVLRLGLDRLPEYLISYMYGGEDGVDAFNLLDWKLFLEDKNIVWEASNLDGRVVLGELNMWAGNYQEAIDIFVGYMTTTEKVGNAGFSYMFTHEPNEVGNGVITAAQFSAANGQQHNLRRLFSRVAPNLYQLAPTENAVNLFNNQIRNNYSKGDYIRGSGVSFLNLSTASGNAYEITKYTLTEDEDQYTSDAAIYVYRVSELNLAIAEAYCFLGKYEESLAFLDNGVDNYWTGNSFKPPFEHLKSIMQKDLGVRERAGLLALDRDSVFVNCGSRQDSIRRLSGLIADEVALELAYEGKRWPVLVRMATHLNEPSFLSEKVSRKFGEMNAPAYKVFLDDRKNWFIPDAKNSTQK